MQMEKLIKKQVTLSIFSFVLISLLVIGTSVAYLRGVTTTSSYKSKIGKLNINFTTGNEISLNTDPIEDTDAINKTDNVYFFSVTNVASSTEETIPYSYKVFLRKKGTATDFDTRFIKYCIIAKVPAGTPTDDGATVAEDVTLDSSSFTTESCSPNSLESLTTTNDKILIASMSNLTAESGKNTIYYGLKIWVSNKYGDIMIPNSIIGKEINLNVYLCGHSGTSVDDLTECTE